MLPPSVRIAQTRPEGDGRDARFMEYLTGCADLFRRGYSDVCKFTCEKAVD
jgi:cyclopropane fatty-acyl-phospholipid synthase-like methyltransferase